MNRKLNYYITAGSLGLLLSAGITFAWNAVWHGTDWIQTAEPIRSREIAENFEFLKKRIDDLEAKITNIDNSTTTVITVEELPTGTVVAACFYSSNDGSTWGRSSSKSCYGGATWGRTMTCPSNSSMFVISGSYGVDSGGGAVTGDGGSLRSYTQGFLCIKR